MDLKISAAIRRRGQNKNKTKQKADKAHLLRVQVLWKTFPCAVSCIHVDEMKVVALGLPNDDERINEAQSDDVYRGPRILRKQIWSVSWKTFLRKLM